MDSADELNEQIALVADIENTRCYPDVAGKWKVGELRLTQEEAFRADNLYGRRTRSSLLRFEGYRRGDKLFSRNYAITQSRNYESFRWRH